MSTMERMMFLRPHITASRKILSPRDLHKEEHFHSCKLSKNIDPVIMLLEEGRRKNLETISLSTSFL